jgi:methionyl-tRNA formyltransferase
MGTPEFAVPTIKKIAENHEVLAVYTQPDKPQGRGKKYKSCPVKIAAQELNILVKQPQNIKDEKIIDELRDLKPDAIIVVAYGQILPLSILKLPYYGCINVHASLLPKYRGAAPIHWAVINGEKETGVSTMLMDEGMDTGDILLQEKIKIDKNNTVGDIHDKLADLGAEIIIKTLAMISNNEIKPIKQDNCLVTYAPKLDENVEKIEWNDEAENIYNKVRGLNPWPGAYTRIHNKRLKVWKTELLNNYSRNNAGKIIDVIPDKGIVIGTGKGELVITELQLQGKKRMNAPSFLRGYQINKYDKLG